jgi:hypothetical protein
MTIGTALFLIAVGAILRYAITDRLAGVNLQVAGLILMVVGAVGLVIALVLTVRGRFARVPPGP